MLPVALATSKVTGNLERKAAPGAATAEPRHVFSGKTRGSRAFFPWSAQRPALFGLLAGLLLGPDAERAQHMRPEGMDQRHVRRVAPPGHADLPDTGFDVPRVEA